MNGTRVAGRLQARDEQEYKLLPQEDIDFVSDWMRWTDEHVTWLRNTKTITGLPSGRWCNITCENCYAHEP